MTTLDFNGASISDAGLVHLHNVDGLSSLNLNDTNVTADGIASLSQALPGCEITWDGGVIRLSAD